MRITDEYLEIKDDRVLREAYDEHLGKHSNDKTKLVLVALKENEDFSMLEIFL